MKNKITNIAGILGLIGLAYNIYTNGGIDVSDFILLGASIGLFAYKGQKKTGGEAPIKDDEETNA